MKKGLLAVVLALSGCTFSVNTAEAPGPPVTNVDRVVLEGSRALVLAHNAYQGVAALVTPAVKAGAFNDQQLDKISELNKKAKTLLAGGDTALTAAQRAQAVFSIVEELYGMVRK